MTQKEEDWTRAFLAERRGDRAAYEAFLRDFSISLRRLIVWKFHRLGLGPDEVEDVVQEVLIAVHSKRRQWDTARPLLPWLNAIARYKTIDTVRRLRRETRGRIDLTEEEWGSIAGSLSKEQPGLKGDVERLVARLPLQQRLVAQTVGLNGLSHGQAALALGISEGSVRVAFHRALKRLTALAREDQHHED